MVGLFAHLAAVLCWNCSQDIRVGREVCRYDELTNCWLRQSENTVKCRCKGPGAYISSTDRVGGRGLFLLIHYGVKWKWITWIINNENCLWNLGRPTGSSTERIRKNRGLDDLNYIIGPVKRDGLVITFAAGVPLAGPFLVFVLIGISCALKGNLELCIQYN